MDNTRKKTMDEALRDACRCWRMGMGPGAPEPRGATITIERGVFWRVELDVRNEEDPVIYDIRM